MAVLDMTHLDVWGHGRDLQPDTLCTLFTFVWPKFWSGRLMMFLASSPCALMGDEVYLVAMN